MNRINVHPIIIHLPSSIQMQHHAALSLHVLPLPKSDHNIQSDLDLGEDPLLWFTLSFPLIGLAILIHPVSPWRSIVPILTIQLCFDSKW